MSNRPTKLEDLDTAELEAEIARRKASEAAAASVPPEPLPLPDYSALRAMVIQGVLDSIEQGYERDDFRAYVYEAAMEAVYGRKYWDWKRKQKW